MFKSIRESLNRTRQTVFGQIVNVLGMGEITEETWEDLEALLIQADVGVPTTIDLVSGMRKRVEAEGLFPRRSIAGGYETGNACNSCRSACL